VVGDAGVSQHGTSELGRRADAATRHGAYRRDTSFRAERSGKPQRRASERSRCFCFFNGSVVAGSCGRVCQRLDLHCIPYLDFHSLSSVLAFDLSLNGSIIASDPCDPADGNIFLRECFIARVFLPLQRLIVKYN